MAEIRTLFDELGKELVTVLLEQVTTVTAEKTVSSQPQRIDIAFEKPGHPIRPDAGLGLLGRMASQGAGMIEYFVKAPPISELEACIRKQLNYHHAQELKAQRGKQTRPKKPFLWVITAGRPVSALHAYEARALRGWPAGVWQTREIDCMRFIVVSDLPADRDSLLLRLLGQERASDQATDELLSLPSYAPEHHLVAASILAFRKRIAQHRKEGKELDMQTKKYFERVNRIAERMLGEARKEGIEKGILQGREQGLEQGLEQGREQGLEQGREQGREQGERTILTRQLTRRFGALPAEIAERIERAGTTQLERWSERVLDARSLDEVFGRARRSADTRRAARK